MTEPIITPGTPDTRFSQQPDVQVGDADIEKKRRRLLGFQERLNGKIKPDRPDGRFTVSQNGMSLYMSKETITEEVIKLKKELGIVDAPSLTGTQEPVPTATQEPVQGKVAATDSAANGTSPLDTLEGFNFRGIDMKSAKVERRQENYDRDMGEIANTIQSEAEEVARQKQIEREKREEERKQRDEALDIYHAFQQASHKQEQRNDGYVDIPQDAPTIEAINLARIEQEIAVLEDEIQQLRGITSTIQMGNGKPFLTLSSELQEKEEELKDLKSRREALQVAVSPIIQNVPVGKPDDISQINVPVNDVVIPAPSDSSIPTVDIPAGPILPVVDIPAADKPVVDVPQVDIPKVDVPQVKIPQVNVPKVDIPSIEIPKKDTTTVKPEIVAPHAAKPKTQSESVRIVPNRYVSVLNREKPFAQASISDQVKKDGLLNDIRAQRESGPVKEDVAKESFTAKETVPVEKDMLNRAQEEIVLRRFEQEFGLLRTDLSTIEGFDALSSGRKLLVLENLKQVTVGRVHEEAIDATEHDIETSGFLGSIWKKMTKRVRLASTEKKKAEELTQGGIEVHGDILRQLVLAAGSGPEAKLIGQGSVELDFAVAKPGASDTERASLEAFNWAANELAHVPYSWSFEEATKEQQTQYRTAYQAYSSARDALLHLASESCEPGDFNNLSLSLQEINEVEHKVQMQRFFVQYPHADQVLADIKSQSLWRKILNDTVSERGVNLTYGYLGKTLLIGAFGWMAAPVASAGLGAFNAWKRTGEQLKAQDIRMRSTGQRGSKQTENAFVDSDRSVRQIERLLDQYFSLTDKDSEEGAVKEAKIRALLEARVSYMQKKLQAGLVSFSGGSIGAVGQIASQYRLMQAMSRAQIVAKRAEKISDRVDKSLSRVMVRRTKDVRRRRSQYTTREIIKGAAISGGFALAGAGVRKLVELWESGDISLTWKHAQGEVGQDWIHRGVIPLHSANPGSSLGSPVENGTTRGVLPVSSETVVSPSSVSTGPLPIPEAAPAPIPQTVSLPHPESSPVSVPYAAPLPTPESAAQTAQSMLEVRTGQNIESQLIHHFETSGMDHAAAGHEAHRRVLEYLGQHKDVTLAQLSRINSANIELDQSGVIKNIEFEPLRKVVRHIAENHSGTMHQSRMQQAAEEILNQRSTPVVVEISQSAAEQAGPPLSSGEGVRHAAQALGEGLESLQNNAPSAMPIPEAATEVARQVLDVPSLAKKTSEFFYGNMNNHGTVEKLREMIQLDWVSQLSSSDELLDRKGLLYDSVARAALRRIEGFVSAVKEMYGNSSDMSILKNESIMRYAGRIMGRVNAEGQTEKLLARAAELANRR